MIFNLQDECFVLFGSHAFILKHWGWKTFAATNGTNRLECRSFGNFYSRLFGLNSLRRSWCSSVRMSAPSSVRIGFQDEKLQFVLFSLRLHIRRFTDRLRGFLYRNNFCTFSSDRFKSEFQLLLTVPAETEFSFVFWCRVNTSVSRRVTLGVFELHPDVLPLDSVSGVFVARPPILTLLQVNEAGCMWAFQKRRRSPVNECWGGKPPEFQCGDSELLMFSGIWSSASLG